MAVYQKADAKSNAGGKINSDRYRIRCVQATASKINDTPEFDKFDLKCEIIEPETINVDGQEVVVAGREFTLYASLNPNKPRGGLADTFAFFTKLGLDDLITEGIDTKKAADYFQGMEWDHILGCVEEVKRYQRKPGQKQGDPILDGEGKQISNGWKVNAFVSDCVENCRPYRNEAVAERPV